MIDQQTDLEAKSLVIASNYDVCIIGGAGHVGLALGLALARAGLSVLLHDINEDAVAKLNLGLMPFMEEGGQAALQESLENKLLRGSCQIEECARAKTWILAMATVEGVSCYEELERCVRPLLSYIQKDQLIILRSTVSPGTTELFASYLTQHHPDAAIAYCPERTVQGQSLQELSILPQLVGGMTAQANERAGALFKTITAEIVYLSPGEAELGKLFCNAFRYIEFAIANEFSKMANMAGLEYEQIRQAIGQHYPRAKSIPRAGFAAGPCLPKDAKMLIDYAGDNFLLGRSALQVNQSMVQYFVGIVEKEHDLNGLKIGILGMAFKPDLDDTRASLSYALKDALAARGALVHTTDPYVTTDPLLMPLEQVIEICDILIMAVPHSNYVELKTLKPLLVVPRSKFD